VDLPAFDPAALVVWLLGPGIGELVIVHAPPGAWLVIDGCAADSVGYAQRVLDHYGARPSLILLSHPHVDHAAGLREVIEQATEGDEESWPRLGMVPAPDTSGVGQVWDPVAALEGGIAEQVVATIHDRWVRHPPCRWTLERGETEELGEASVRVLSPLVAVQKAAADAWRTRARFDYNRAATALLLTWKHRRVLLGSDLVERPGGGWSSAMELEDLGDHEIYKIAHHGSETAHARHLVPSPGRPARHWVATPFSRRGLPRRSDLEPLLETEPHVLLTGLPIPHREQSGRPEDVPSSRLAESSFDFPERTLGFPDCWLAIELPAEGPVRITRGPGSVYIHK
jgi:hypothetical protein